MATVLPLEKTWNDARNLMTRFQEASGFRQYVAGRLAFVLPAGVLFLLIGIACASATVIFLAEVSSLLALPGLLLAPFVLIGSLFVQFYVFFAWLEGLALQRALRRRKKAAFDFGELPPVPWAFAAMFLFIPLLLLAKVSAIAALALILLAVLVPVLIARFDA